MTTFRERIFGPGREGITIPVKKVKASRARYIDRDIQRVEMDIEVDIPGDSARIILDLSPSQAAQLIQQLTTAYEVINPPLRRGSGFDAF